MGDSNSATPQFGDREPASEKASKAMSGNRSEDTKPEKMLRSELWGRGLRYRVHLDELPGSPDIAFLSEKIAVFCDGDFWHGRDWDQRKKKLADGANADYWVPKIQANRERDRRYNKELREMGWTVLRFWESDIREAPEEVADVVEEAIESSH